MAPEIFETKFDKIGYGFKSDIYSLGVFIYELYFGKPPFPYVFDITEDNIKSYYNQVKKGIDDSYFSGLEDNEFNKQLKSLIKGCMEVDESKRLNIHELKKHKCLLQA